MNRVGTDTLSEQVDFYAQMLVDLIGSGIEVRVCGTCISSRGLKSKELVDGAIVGKMLDLAHLVEESSKVLIF